MDHLYGRRGKRRVKRSCNSSHTKVNPQKNDLIEQFEPITLVRKLGDMTCTVQNGESDGTLPSSCSYYRCKNCPQGFCSEEEYVQHTRTHHAQAPPPADKSKRPSRSVTLTCHTCKYTAPDSNKAVLHEKLHRDQRGGATVFKCKTCHFLSCSKMGITIHKRLEHAPLKYECPMCNYSSFNARHVTAHVDKVHCNPVEESWSCPYCSTELDSGLKLKTHIQSEHTDESQFKEFTCDLCDYVCQTNTDIVHHMKAHRAKKKLFKCPKCLFISVKFDKYAKHFDVVHDEVQTEECPQEELIAAKSEEKGNIPVIRVIQKKETDCRSGAEEVDINNAMYTPPTSPVVKPDPTVKPDPGNIFDKINLKNQDKVKVCRAVGLRASPRKKLKNVDTKQGRVHKLRLSGPGIMGRRALKRCRYCTTKTMFDTLTKLREHHIKAHGISDLGVQLGMRQYKCKYCPEKQEFEGLAALKDHYAAVHPDSSVRKLVKRSRSQNESNESGTSEITEIPKIKPSLLDEIDIAETSCETKRQDMLDCILQSQKQIGKALKDSSPECNLTKSRIGRIQSAPSATYDKPPSVKPVMFGSDHRVGLKSLVGSAPPSPLIPPATLHNLGTITPNKTIPDYQDNLGTSIYNLSLAELQYLQQCYLYQAYCMNMYYTDPIYRQYVHEKQLEMLQDRGRKEQQVLSLHPPPSFTQRPIVKISDPRSLAQPSPAAQPTVALELTKPKLGSPPVSSPRSVPSKSDISTHRCFVAACPFNSPRLLDLKRHISEAHNIRITDTMEAELEKLIRAQEGVKIAPERVVPNVTLNNRTYPCSHCSQTLNSFDSYVQHMIEVHRSELGIVSQGSLPNTFNTHFSGPAKTSTNMSRTSTSPNKREENSAAPAPVTIKPDVQSPSSSRSSGQPSTSSGLVNGTSGEGFECTSCYHVASSAAALERHEKVHDTTYHKCTVCEYLAPSQGSLNVHMNVHKT
ncbi:hypothetical protein ACHWQZ_G008075 [Mnemiopsis leidyi]